MNRPLRKAACGRLARAALLLLWVCCSTVGCSLFDNLDRFSSQADAGSNKGNNKGSGKDVGGRGAGKAGNSGGAGNTGGSGPSGCESPQTLCVRLKNFSPHVGELAGVGLVTSDGILRARAILDPIAPNGGSDADVVMPLAIPASEVPTAGDKHSLHVEIFGDKNEDGMYTSDGSDHDWKAELPADGKLVFAHNSQFTRLLPRPASIGGDFHMRFKGMAVHTGKVLEVMVIEQDSGRAVGLYRLQSIPGDQFEIAIPGIIDVGGIAYRVEFYADANGNLRYDDPPGDHTWLSFAESNDQGVDFEFVHGTNFTPLTYQFTFNP